MQHDIFLKNNRAVTSVIEKIDEYILSYSLDRRWLSKNGVKK